MESLGCAGVGTLLAWGETEGRWSKGGKWVPGLQARQRNGEVVVWRDVKGKETAGLGIRLAVRKGRRTHMSSWEPQSSLDVGSALACRQFSPGGGRGAAWIRQTCCVYSSSLSKDVPQMKRVRDYRSCPKARLILNTTSSRREVIYVPGLLPSCCRTLPKSGQGAWWGGKPQAPPLAFTFCFSFPEAESCFLLGFYFGCCAGASQGL